MKKYLWFLIVPFIFILLGAAPLYDFAKVNNSTRKQVGTYVILDDTDNQFAATRIMLGGEWRTNWISWASQSNWDEAVIDATYSTNWIATNVVGAAELISTDSPYAVPSGNDRLVFCDTDAGDITNDLPAGELSRYFKFVNCGNSNHVVILNPNGAELIWGKTNFTLLDGEILDLHYSVSNDWW